jgi:rsbT antagonist protein RsbS
VPEPPAPLAILHEGSCLVVSIDAALDDAQMMRFRQDLGEAISGPGIRGVLIDVTALDVIDSFGSRTIRDIADLARLRGATAVIVGVHPHLALAMVHLGIDAGALPTALDLEDGLDVVDDRRASVRRRSSPDGTGKNGSGDTR